MPDRAVGISAPVIPNPDPSIVTSEAIDRRVENSERVLTARIDGMAKAVEVFQADLTRVPTQLDRAIQGQRDLMDAQLLGHVDVLKQRLDGMDKAIDLFQKFTDKQPDFVRDQVIHLRELHDAGFESVRTQFNQLKQAAEQLDVANKTAIERALQAQKESAAETQRSSEKAIAKSETSTAEAIKALTIAFNTAIQGATGRIDDLKGRLDRGEGKTDPETANSMRALTDKIASLADTRSHHAGSEQALASSQRTMLVIIGIIVTAAVGVSAYLSRAVEPPAVTTSIQQKAEIDSINRRLDELLSKARP